MAFDTLAYVKRLETAGIDRREAEAHAEAINETLRPDIATRTDLDALRRDLRADVAAVRAEMVAMELRLLNGIRTELATRAAHDRGYGSATWRFVCIDPVHGIGTGGFRV